MVGLNSRVAIIGVDALVTGFDGVVHKRNGVSVCVYTNVVNTIIAALNQTVAELDFSIRSCRIAGGTGCASGTADGEAGVVCCVCVVGDDLTVVKSDVSASISAEQHGFGGDFALSGNGQILEMKMFGVGQGHRTIDVVAGIRVVVGDNDIVPAVTLEGDGVHRGLAIVFCPVKITIGAGAQVEGDGTVDVTIVQRHLDGIDVRKIRVAAAYSVVAVEKTVTGKSRVLDGVVGMIPIGLSVTGCDVGRDVVESAGGREGSQGKGIGNVHTDATRPVVRGVMGDLMVLIFHFQHYGQ